MEDFRIYSSVLADLGPLPDVVETDSETTWQAFLQLQAQPTGHFCTTAPSSSSRLAGGRHERASALCSVDEVMAIARRQNRICPVEARWAELHALLCRGNPGAPPAMTGAEWRKTPPLAKRIRVRDQVEWSAQYGMLPQVYKFLSSLPEDQWVHMGR